MKKYCVISHTHWDREWYMPFEVFRLKLVDLIDSVIECIEQDKDYIFHMDAQTIVLEDYCVIRPEKKEVLKRYIENGNIIIGPWYVQNDFYLSSAEATVRNLIIGIKQSEEWGETSFIGYTPDQFGLPSQLPQILCECNIYNHIFGRGDATYNLTTMEKVPTFSETLWEAPDGSRVFSVLMPYWYNNIQRLSEDIGKAVEMIETAAENLDNWKDSPYYLMMNGVDHLEPQENLLDILNGVNKKLGDAEIIQTTMKEYINLAKPYVSDIVKKGELRRGKELDILTGTLSTRTDIKKLNFEMQKAITDIVEPLFSMIYMLGAKNMYPQTTIGYALKILISNHAHDSICCCSHNNVMKHMKDRFLSVEEITGELISRGMKFLNHHIQRNEADNDKYYLTVANTCQSDFSGVLNVCIDIARSQNAKGFTVYDAEGKEVPYQIISHSVGKKECISPLNLPGSIDVDRFIAEIYIKKLEGFSYENFLVVPNTSIKKKKVGNLLENEYLKIVIEDGKINLIDKVNNNEYKDVVYFDDLGDCGDSYIFMPVDRDVPVRGGNPDVEIISNTLLKSSVRLTYKLDIPLSSVQKGRSKEKKISTVECIISLAKGEKHALFDIIIDNNSEYHLLRGIINTGINTNITYASSVFDIIERDRSKIIRKINNGTQPVNEFVYIKDEKRKMAIYTMGLYEYEHLESGGIALSLLRSVGRITSNHVAESGIWDSSENVMKGKTKVSFAIMPYMGDDKIIPIYEKCVTSRPINYFDSVNKKLYLAGEPTLQGSDVQEFYEKKDDYSNLVLPNKKKLLNINNSLCVSAMKKAEESEDLILRVYNPWNNDEILTVDGFECVETNFIERKNDKFSGSVEKKKIKTLKIIDSSCKYKNMECGYRHLFR